MRKTDLLLLEHQNAYKLLVDLESTFGHAADFLSLAATSRRIGDFNRLMII